MSSAPGDKVHSLAKEVHPKSGTSFRAASSTLFPKNAELPPGKFSPIKTLAQIRGTAVDVYVRFMGARATIKGWRDFRIIIIANEVSRRGNPRGGGFGRTRKSRMVSANAILGEVS